MIRDIYENPIANSVFNDTRLNTIEEDQEKDNVYSNKFIQHCFRSSSHWKKARNKMNTDSKGPSRTYFRGYETV